MNKDEFYKYCRKFNDNYHEKITNFKLTCKKCGSTKIHLLHNGKEYAMGSEYTGAYTSQDEELVLKCETCGIADILRGNQS